MRIIKNILWGILGLVVILLVMQGGYKFIKNGQVKIEKRVEQQQEDVEKEVQAFIDEYVSKMQRALCTEELPDIVVTCKALSREEYEKEFGKTRYGFGDYLYFYMLDYMSESIGDVYEQMTKDGDYSRFIDLMNEIRRGKLRIEAEYNIDWDNVYRLEVNSKTAYIHVNDHVITNCMTVKQSPDQTYELAQNKYLQWVCVNGGRVFERSRETTQKYATYSSNRSTSSIRQRQDPYDVYDYDDPDDFAEEWAEEFGDGDYESGYEDAYDYWVDERE